MDAEGIIIDITNKDVLLLLEMLCFQAGIRIGDQETLDDTWWVAGARITVLWLKIDLTTGGIEPKTKTVQLVCWNV